MKKSAAKTRIALPGPEQELALHGRLLDGDHTATTDLAVAYLDHLIDWLIEHNPGISEDFCREAAGEALCALMKIPQSYRPSRSDSLSLVAYLHMSAQGDLRNLLRKEARHQRRRKSWESVEQSPLAGKYLARENDPSLPMQINEEVQAAASHVLPAVRDGLSPMDLHILELMLQGERSTSVYAKVCQLDHLPVPQQRAEVKRLKDKLKQRLKRARADHDQ